MAPTKKFAEGYLELLKGTNPKLRKLLIQQAPVPIIKLISNAAIQAANGNLHLSPDKKKKFRAKAKLFKVLTSKKSSFTQKRKVLTQKGGAAFLPILLGTVLSALGPALFGG